MGSEVVIVAIVDVSHGGEDVGGVDGTRGGDRALGDTGAATEDKVDRFDAEMIDQPGHHRKKVSIARDGAGHSLQWRSDDTMRLDIGGD